MRCGEYGAGESQPRSFAEGGNKNTLLTGRAAGSFGPKNLAHRAACRQDPPGVLVYGRSLAAGAGGRKSGVAGGRRTATHGLWKKWATFAIANGRCASARVAGRPTMVSIRGAVAV